MTNDQLEELDRLEREASHDCDCDACDWCEAVCSFEVELIKHARELIDAAKERGHLRGIGERCEQRTQEVLGKNENLRELLRLHAVGCRGISPSIDSAYYFCVQCRGEVGSDKACTRDNCRLAEALGER